jgi:hypothetical protein
MARGTMNGPTFFGPFSLVIRAAARSGDHPGAIVRDLRVAEACVGDRLFHREIGIGCAVAHEATQAAVDQLVDIELERAGDLAPEAEFLVLRHRLDAGLALLQRLRHLGGVVADRGDDSQAGDDDTFHVSRPARQPPPHPGRARL